MIVPLVLALIAASPFLCDRPAPEPRSFHSRGFGRVAEIFPPGSRHNDGERPLAYLYEVAHPGSRWEVRARRVWSAPLPHGRFPSEAVVSVEGHLVTLDDYYEPGGPDAVVLLDGAGRHLGSHALSDLLTEREIAALERSDCGIHWREGARYYFLTGAAPRFYVVLASALALEFDLARGGFRRGPADAFPDLVEVMGQPWADEEAGVWPTSLRFSSITDVVGSP